MEKLGIDPKLLVTQIVNFTIMVLLLSKLLYKPILKSLDARKKKIEEGLRFAEKAQVEEEKLKLRREEMLKETREEARVILVNTKKDAQKLKDEMLVAGKKELELLKLKQEKEVMVRFEELSSRVTAQTVDIAAEMVRRLIPNIMTSETQKKLIEKELKGLRDIHVRQ